jgi:hypothetical protein
MGLRGFGHAKAKVKITQNVELSQFDSSATVLPNGASIDG